MSKPHNDRYPPSGERAKVLTEAWVSSLISDAQNKLDELGHKLAPIPTDHPKDLERNLIIGACETILFHAEQYNQHRKNGDMDGAIWAALSMNSAADSIRHIIPDFSKHEIAKIDGQKGGKTPKRKAWADMVAKRLKEEAPKGTLKKNVWDFLPDENFPWEFDMGEYDLCVYKDEDTLIAVNDYTGREEDNLKRASFEARYYKKPTSTGQ